MGSRIVWKQSSDAMDGPMTDQSNNRQGADNPLAVARDLLGRQIMPLPVAIGQKNPTIVEWQKLVITTANVHQYFHGAELTQHWRQDGRQKWRPHRRRS
jgi:hypothetical protein